ncbi:MAG: hypothetical protein F6K47_04370 [Symploca sp. SIO2E6]|nr:hypothetical protein [Symploca sp. SIO2E6]
MNVVKLISLLLCALVMIWQAPAQAQNLSFPDWLDKANIGFCYHANGEIYTLVNEPPMANPVPPNYCHVGPRVNYWGNLSKFGKEAVQRCCELDGGNFALNNGEGECNNPDLNESC